MSTARTSMRSPLDCGAGTSVDCCYYGHDQVETAPLDAVHVSGGDRALSPRQAALHQALVAKKQQVVQVSSRQIDYVGAI